MPMNQTSNLIRSFSEREILTPAQLVASLTCRKLHDYRYRRLLVPKEENERLTLCLAIDRGLSAWYGSFDKARTLSAVEQSLRESTLRSSLLPLASGMLEGYVEHWKRRDAFTVLHVDLPYITPIITPSGSASRIQDLAGVAPLVIEKPDGSVWLVLHRTIARKDPNLAERLETDLRIRAACWALDRALHGGISGVIVSVLRAKLPAEPEILKNGTVSKRANIDTTLEKFTESLNCRGSDFADYFEILERLAGEDNSFFLRWERGYTFEEMAAIGRELYFVARDLRRSGREPVFGNPNACTSFGLCPYLDLCIAGVEPDGADGTYRRLDILHPALAGVDFDSLRHCTRRIRNSGSRSPSRQAANAAYVQ